MDSSVEYRIVWSIFTVPRNWARLSVTAKRRRGVRGGRGIANKAERIIRDFTV